MRSSPRMAGFTLIELMISVVLGLILLLLLGRLMAEQDAARAETERSTRQVENGRFAATTIQDDVASAGYYGSFGALPTEAPTAIPDPCETGLTPASLANIRESLRVAIQSVEDPDCIPAENIVPDSSVLLVRRTTIEEVQFAPTAAEVTGAATTVFLQATPVEFILNLGGSAAPATFTLTERSPAPGVPGPVTPVRQYTPRMYYVSPCNRTVGGVCTAASDNGRPVPTLKRADLVEGTWVETTISEGIEQLAIDYAIDDNADGSGDRFTTETELADMTRVVGVKINLLARGLEPSAGHLDEKTYTLGEITVGPFNDSFKRQPQSLLARANSISGRLE